MLTTYLRLLLNPLGLVSVRWGFWHPALHLGFEILGYVVSLGVYRWQACPDILQPDQRQRLKWWTLGGAILGAKLVPILENIQSPAVWFVLLSGKSLAGGLLGGIIGTEIGKLKAKIPVSTGDVLVWPLLLGSLAGRLGCASCAVMDGMLGSRLSDNLLTQFPWVGLLSVAVPKNLAVAFEVQQALHLKPGIYWNVAMLEILGLICIAGAMWLVVQWKNRQAGVVFYSFCLGYFMLRIALEAVKHPVIQFSVVQGVSLIGVLLSGWRLCRAR
jgi:prolipoprotein diacylglyceryltransferase